MRTAAFPESANRWFMPGAKHSGCICVSTVPGRQGKFMSVLQKLFPIYLGTLMAVLEESFGSHPEWQRVRSRVLKIFGDRGFQDLLKGGGGK